jgi:hypothetical protein
MFVVEFFKSFFTWQHLSEAPAKGFGPQNLKIVIIVFGACFVLGILAWIFSGLWKKKPIAKSCRAFSRWGIIMGIIGGILVFFRQIGLPFVNRRILLAAWLVGAIIWLILLIRWLLVKMPRKKEKLEKKEEFEKYLPK